VKATERRERLVLIALILPALGWLAFAQGYPLLYSLYLSFMDWSLANSPTPQGFAGLSNFTSVLSDERFQGALKLSALFMAKVPIELAIGFALALFTLGQTLWHRGVRTLLLIPMLIAPIAVGSMWRLLLNSRSGLVNNLLNTFGLPAPNWLGEPTTAALAVIWGDTWEWIPFSMIIYVAALSGLDQSLLESAQVEGASRWQVTRHILIPLTLPATLLILVFRLIDAFIVIDIVYSLTYGGPGFATETASLYVFKQGLQYFNISQATAGSWLLLVISFVVAGMVLALKNRVDRAVARG
jgi:multiple sugar transport system permease protein